MSGVPEAPPPGGFCHTEQEGHPARPREVPDGLRRSRLHPLRGVTFAGWGWASSSCLQRPACDAAAAALAGLVLLAHLLTQRQILVDQLLQLSLLHLAALARGACSRVDKVAAECRPKGMTLKSAKPPYLLQSSLPRHDSSVAPVSNPEFWSHV